MSQLPRVEEFVTHHEETCLVGSYLFGMYLRARGSVRTIMLKGGIITPLGRFILLYSRLLKHLKEEQALTGVTMEQLALPHYARRSFRETARLMN